jgi:uncharacterized protein YjbI with pentapeptide repeats
MESKKDLIKRWEKDEGALGKEILSAIRCSYRMEKVKGLKKINGKWDLRGLKFPNPQKVDTIKSYEKVSGAFLLKNVVIEDVDLSYADLSYTEWQNCKVDASIFTETKFRSVNIAASDFLNSNFTKSDFRNSFIGQNIAEKSGSFINVKFIESDLSNAGFCFPRVEECLFDNCKLKDTDFDGSRFTNCKFKGLLDSCFFRGYSVHAHSSFLWIFNRVRVKEYLNPMQNVDFSEAQFFGVSFTHEINLKQCILPSDGSVLLIEDLERTYNRAKSVINKEWNDDEYKRIAVEYIDKIFLNKDRQNQLNDIIDLNTLSEGNRMEEFGRKFFNVLKVASNCTVEK